jgi:hypothetical protein
MASLARGEDAGSSRQKLEASNQQAESLFKQGAIICITHMDMADPELARWRAVGYGL